MVSALAAWLHWMRNGNRSPMRRFGRIVLLGIVGLTIPNASSRVEELPKAEFAHESHLTTNEGHVSLEWGGDGELLEYELQSAQKPDFLEPMKLYQGTDTTSFLSGLADGRHFFRVRARTADGNVWGPWSPSVELICEHHSLTLAWLLFASGGTLFFLIVLFVAVNARSLNRFERSDA